MTVGGEAIWDWLKKAPLPVVLAISLSSTLVLGSWLWAVDGKAGDAAQAAAVASESKRAVEQRVQKMDEKLDKLLEVVLELKAEKKVADEAAKKKERK